MKDKRSGVLMVLLPVIFWGMSFVSTEYLLHTMGAMMIVGIRFLIGTILLFAVLKAKGGIHKPKKEHIPLFLLAGGIGIVAYFYFENVGILHIGANASVMMIGTLPVITMIFDSIVSKTKFSFLHFCVVALSSVGVALIVLSSLKQGESAGSLLGYIFMAISILTWVVYSLSTKKLNQNYSHAEVTFYQFLFSLPFFVIFIPFETTNWEQIGMSQFLHIAFLSVLSSVLGFYLYNKAIDYIGVTEASVFLNFMPIVTMIYSFFYLGSTITWLQLGGCVLIILSATVAVKMSGNAQRT